MSDKLPSLTGKELVEILKRAGFYVKRQRGSHVFLEHKDGRRTVIPIHAGEVIGQGLLSKILRDIKMTKEDLIKLIK